MKRWRGGEERGGKGKERRGKERTGEVRGGKEKKGSQRGEATVQRQLGGGLINLKGGDPPWPRLGWFHFPPVAPGGNF
jgi:hypothetical protein